MSHGLRRKCNRSVSLNACSQQLVHVIAFPKISLHQSTRQTVERSKRRDRQTDRLTGRQAGRQAGRDRQRQAETDRQTERERERLILAEMSLSMPISN